MAWKRYLKVVPQSKGHYHDVTPTASGNKYASWLPEVYSGQPNRIERYAQYDQMDLDSEINASLDTLADFCTQTEEADDQMFSIHFNEDPTETEVNILETSLRQWTTINEFRKRLWRTFRNTLKYGDQIFIRDPQTFEWLWVDHSKVQQIFGNEAEGKKPEAYVITDLDYNITAKCATNQQSNAQKYANFPMAWKGSPMGATMNPSGPAFGVGGQTQSRFATDPQAATIVDAEHIVHLSLSEGMDNIWPFGTSILEPIFKTYKQKELLEDSIIIYRVQRAPERRVFYIDTGNMPPTRAMQYVERIKNEIHQRRIPNRTGGGSCFDMNTEVPLLDGRILTITDLAKEFKEGKQNWAYSCNPNTGEMVPGKITWAGVTRRNTEVIRLTLDNGEIIVCTPDHFFPILGKGFVEAKDIVIGEDNLFGFKYSIDKSGSQYYKIVKIENLNPQDTGTITIDGNEEYHDYHTFAIKQGVYTKNSILDAAYNPLCISLDTEIPLLDGRILNLNQLIEEFDNGKENWVYSCNPDTGAIVPGNITWAGITRKNAQVIRLTLDNGKTLTVTPDHNFPVLGRGKVQAKDLQPNDSLISFETRYRNIDRNLKNERTYQQVYDHEKNCWKYTHRIVAEFFKDKQKHQEFTFLPENINKDKNTIHHKDFNRYNNDPRNLQWMNKQDHINYHVYSKQEYWDNISEEEYNRITTKISNSLKQYFENRTDEEKITFSQMRSVKSKEVAEKMRRENPEKFNEWQRKSGESLSKFINENEEYKNTLINRLEIVRKPFKGNQELTFTREMFNRFATLVNQYDWDRLDALAGLPQDQDFMKLYSEANQPSVEDRENYKIKTDSISEKCLKKMILHFGYKNWKDFKKKASVYNHKIVKIEYLEETMDTGTITVDGGERWHNYHTFATDSGCFIFNSIIEDYFFAQSSEGRGSKVETLPGGEGLGDIKDLEWFDSKMKRGLRIPASYLPSGGEEGTSSFSDGRVGTAYIQEYIFAKYCSRLQSLLVDTFDNEFKLFLKKSGVIIHPKLFEIRFHPPQNFSKFRQIEMDTAHISVFGQLAQVKWLSQRFLGERYLGLTQEELMKNERYWREENASKLKNKTDANADAGGLRDVGIGSMVPPPMGGDMGTPPDDGSAPPPDAGTPGAPPPGAGAPPPGGGAAPGGATPPPMPPS